MGFPAPNYTQVPNVLLDEWMPILSHVELKVLYAITRKTFGWHKDRDRISLSQLEKLTGSTKEAIVSASRTLQKRGLINKLVIGDPGRQATYYELVVNEDSNNCYPSAEPTPPSRLGRPTKETKTKEIKAKQSPTPFKKGERKSASAFASASSSNSIEDKIKKSIIPEKDHKAVLSYYARNKTLVDGKDNPIGWLVKMWKLRKHEGEDKFEENKKTALKIEKSFIKNKMERKVTCGAKTLEIHTARQGTIVLDFSDSGFKEQCIRYIKSFNIPTDWI